MLALVTPRVLVRSVGPLKEFLWCFSRSQMSEPSSLGERERFLAATLDFLLRRLRQRKHKPINAANARAPSVQPRTIGRMLELPLPPLLLLCVDDAAAADALEADDCAAAELVGVDAADARVADVDKVDDAADDVTEVEELEDV